MYLMISMFNFGESMDSIDEPNSDASISKTIKLRIKLCK